ncbi:hypothetical protein ACI2KR_27950 [Pseudomonas luteola]
MEDHARISQQFDVTLKRLKRQAEYYDKGDHECAPGLSTLIVNLIGDRTKKNGQPSHNFISLSQRLDRKPAQMLDLSLQAIRMDGLHGPICAMGFHVLGAKGLAPLLDGPGPSRWEGNLLPFEEWWAQTVIRDGLGREHTRQSIVETMRDQEEAHIDSTLEPGYGALAYGGALSIVQHNQAIFPLDTNPTRVAVRQIAHEVLRSFEPQMDCSFSRIGGGVIEPITLVQLEELQSDGNWAIVTDRDYFRYLIESTSDVEVAKKWSSDYGLDRSLVSKTSLFTKQGYRMRLAMMSYDNVAIEGVKVRFQLNSEDT